MLNDISIGMKPLGIYIHIPYCVRRCPYCGFYSNACGAGYKREIKEYFGLLKKELEFRHDDYDTSYYVDSIYFGGGTPSLADPDLIGGMIDEIRSLYEVADDCEISMEANPGTLSGVPVRTQSIESTKAQLYDAAASGGCSGSKEESGRYCLGSDAVSNLKAYKEAGVNRLSLGVQSFDDSVLRTLGRIHSAEDARRAYSDARAAGFDNVSMDLMFGVPGQTEEIWESTVSELASMLPEHVSFYSLQIEEGTKFYSDYKMGDMVPVSDEGDRQMYHSAIEILREHGYRQYEISNAALPGRECRHNLKYWTFRDYLGIGASASSFIECVRQDDLNARQNDTVERNNESVEGSTLIGRVRMTNPGAGYRDFAEEGFSDDRLVESHRNSCFDNAADYMITGLRLADGIDEADFTSRFGKNVWEMFPDAKKELQEFFDDSIIVEEDGRLYISEQGFDVSNRILESFV